MSSIKRRTRSQVKKETPVGIIFKSRKKSSSKANEIKSAKRSQDKGILEKDNGLEGSPERGVEHVQTLKGEADRVQNLGKEVSTDPHVKMETERDFLGKNTSNKFTFVTEGNLSSILRDIKQPNNWSEIYNKVVATRAKFSAPVDHVGCEKIPEVVRGNDDEHCSKSYRIYLLVSLMLSSQTKDEATCQALLNLHWGLKKRGFASGITLESIIALSEEEIDTLIEKVGFHKRKAAYIKNACFILIEKFDSDIPKSIEQVVSLPGVGPKMGYLLLQHAWNINSGIGVDAHVHRLSQLWGWAPTSNNPEITRAQLELFLPRIFWSEINPLLVGFGQVICVPNAPNCDICPLGYASLCRGAKKHLLQKPSEERIEKLLKNRADLTQLINDIEDLV